MNKSVLASIKPKYCELIASGKKGGIKMKEVAKACPKCHRLMKSAVVAGKNVWICIRCGLKTEARDNE